MTFLIKNQKKVYVLFKNFIKNYKNCESFLTKTEKDLTVRPNELYEKTIRSKRPEIFFFSFNTKKDDGLICACAIKLKKKIVFFAEFEKKK